MRPVGRRPVLEWAWRRDLSTMTYRYVNRRGETYDEQARRLRDMGMEWGWVRGEDGRLRYVNQAGQETAEQWPFEGMERMENENVDSFRDDESI